MNILKRCAKCKEEKSIDCFSKHKSRKDGHDCYCKICEKDRKKKYSNMLKEYSRKYDLKKIFNMDIEEYDQMLKNQNNRCPICNRHQDGLKKAMCVDHDHITNEVRGLLCTKCNLRLGAFNDNIEDMKRAIIYLEKYKK